jgi:O-antigen ligase
MTTLALASRQGEVTRIPLLILAVALACAGVIYVGISWNTAIALTLSLAVVMLFLINRPVGVTAGIIFYLVKAAFVRFAFGFDQVAAGTNRFDLLGMAPTLVLGILIVANLYSDYAAGKPIAPDKPRKLALALATISFLSIFFPTNTLVIGLAGFQRNLLPNLLIMFLAASVWHDTRSKTNFVRAFLMLGVISCLYGLGQWLCGTYSWEEAWLLDQFTVHGEHGFMTIGLRGIEFRIFSIYFSYMDFFFTNVVIFALVLAFRDDFAGWWRLLRIAYFILWVVMLVLSVERMPMLMTLVVALGVGYLRKPRARRRVLLRRYLVIGVGLYLILFASAPMLKATGAQTLARLSEMANPFAASSILDRSNSNWGPTLAIIAAHPWGTGIGYGSQTRASSEAAETDMYAKPHNELLQKILEIGFVGGIIYLLLLVSIFKTAITRKQEDDQLSRLAIAFAATSVAFWLCGMVNIPFSGASGLMYWAVAGILLAQVDGRVSRPSGTEAA